jgi:hypothetical protein
MPDKRTPPSQYFKNFLQLQQHPQSKPNCHGDVFPQQRFDFIPADPSAGTTYELLKSTYVYLDATQSPICSTLLTAINTFEEFVAHSSYTLSTAVALSIQYQLAAPSPSKAPTPATSTSSRISSVRAHADDEILFLLDSSTSQLESTCVILESQIQLCESLYTINLYQGQPCYLRATQSSPRNYIEYVQGRQFSSRTPIVFLPSSRDF